MSQSESDFSDLARQFQNFRDKIRGEVNLAKWKQEGRKHCEKLDVLFSVARRSSQGIVGVSSKDGRRLSFENGGGAS